MLGVRCKAEVSDYSGRCPSPRHKAEDRLVVAELARAEMWKVIDTENIFFFLR